MNAIPPGRLRALGRVADIVERLGLARPAIYALIALRRFWIPPMKTRAFAGYTPTERDVFICTHAKSGTNLLMHMVHRLAHRGAGDFDHIHDRVPWPEAPHETGASIHDPPPYGPTGLRAIKTHLDATHVPYSAAARYIVVVRDPLDVAVSGYHFSMGIFRAKLNAEFSRDEWFELCVQDRLPIGSWADHTASWWELRARANVLLLSFEDCVRAPAECVDSVATFLAIALTPEQRARVIELCSFAWMKAHDRAFAPPFAVLPGRATPFMIRKGVAGDSARFFTEEQRARLIEFYRDELARRGSSFPYDQLIAHAPISSWPDARAG